MGLAAGSFAGSRHDVGRPLLSPTSNFAPLGNYRTPHRYFCFLGVFSLPPRDPALGSPKAGRRYFFGSLLLPCDYQRRMGALSLLRTSRAMAPRPAFYSSPHSCVALFFYLAPLALSIPLDWNSIFRFGTS